MARAKKPAKTRAKRASALKAVAPTKEAISESSEAALSSSAPNANEYAGGRSDYALDVRRGNCQGA